MLKFISDTPKLLLVDDRYENILALSAVLKDQGYEMIEALSGKEALAQVENHDFVAILMDVQMPEMDGFETAQKIRQWERSASTPIIFITALYRSEAYEHKGYIVGAADYLFKPINVEILLAKLAVFTDLYRKNLKIKKQAEQLQAQAIQDRENQWLKAALRSRDEFLSMASHELKTPITPLNLQMQAFLQMLEDGTFETMDPARLKRMIQTSYSQVERLARTIEELLDVSRFSTGHIRFSFETIDLVAMVQRVVDSFAAQLKDLKCDCEIKAPTSLLAHCDPFRVEQVFINILSNAMKYGAGKPIEIRLKTNQEFAELSVQDQGIGIAPDDQGRIFNRFERAVSPRSYGGLGLGLYIAIEIIKGHKGFVEVKSELGTGAEFLVKLPLKHEDQAGTHSSP